MVGVRPETSKIPFDTVAHSPASIPPRFDQDFHPAEDKVEDSIA